MTEKPAQSLPRMLGSDVVAIALASVVAYAVALRYDRAFLGYYGVAADSTSLTKSGVFLALGGVFGPFLIVMIGLHESVLSATSARTRFVAAIGLFAFVGGAYPAIIFDDTRVRVTGLILVGAVLLILLVAFSELRKLAHLLESPLWFVFVIGLIALVVAPIYGAGAASSKSTYLVLRSRPGYAVVRIEDNRVIAAQFSGSRFTGNLLIVPLGNRSIALQTRHLAHLHAAPSSQ